VNLSHSTGPNVLKLDISKDYYHSSNDSVSVYVWGFSSVTWLSPSDGSSFAQGSSVPLTCNVTDSNSSGEIEDYTVYFYVRNSTTTTALGSNNTRSDGTAVFGWDTSNYGTDDYEAYCNITDNSSLYYNASSANRDNASIEISTSTITGVLEVNLTRPLDQTVSGYNKLFTINATVVCRDGDCGNVQGTPRYNFSAATPDAPISTGTGDKPFFIVSDSNPKSCPNNPISQDEECNLTWTVNASGDPWTSWMIDVLWEGTQTLDNDTSDVEMMIQKVLILNLSSESIDFGLIEPGVSGTAAPSNPLTITITNDSNDADALWISGTNLTNLSNTIGVSNVSWCKCSVYGNAFRLNETYNTITSPAPSGLAEDVNFWLDVPYGVPYGIYSGSVYVMINTSV